MNRKERVLGQIDRNGLGLEVGPSHDPIAPKRAGFKVHVVDHMSREQLRQKYAGEPVNLDNVEEVDFVWHGEPYAQLTGRAKSYDWIIASHVIEHTPDLVAFLENCDAILKDTGVLVLVVPDKRYCFDRFRPITGLARIVDAHVAGNTIHSPGVVAEYFMNVVSKGGLGGWNAGAPGDYRFYHSVADALTGMKSVSNDKAYLDVHNWCFVPHSFRLLMEDLFALGLTRLREVDFAPTTEGFEFHVTLGRQGRGPGISRMEMLGAVDAEVATLNEAAKVPAEIAAPAGIAGWLRRRFR